MPGHTPCPGTEAGQEGPQRPCKDKVGGTGEERNKINPRMLMCEAAPAERQTSRPPEASDTKMPGTQAHRAQKKERERHPGSKSQDDGYRWVPQKNAKTQEKLPITSRQKKKEKEKLANRLEESDHASVSGRGSGGKGPSTIPDKITDRGGAVGASVVQQAPGFIETGLSSHESTGSLWRDAASST